MDHIINGLSESNLTRWIPLSFCSLFIYAIWLSNFKCKFIHKIGSTFLVSGCLYAGLAYLIYPSTGLGDWPWWHFYSVHGMTYHALMLFTGIINLLYGDTKPTFNNFKYYIMFTYFFIFIALIVNKITGVSFMFLGEPYALPQIINDIYNLSPILYTTIVILGYTLLYIISAIVYKIYLNKKEAKHV